MNAALLCRALLAALCCACADPSGASDPSSPASTGAAVPRRGPPSLPPPAAGAPPRLVVLVILDQCRADYLERFAELLSQEGLGRLLRDGAWFPAAEFSHTVTSTGPGHAAIASGCLPARAGIPGNVWLDARTGRPVACVDDAGAHLVGAPDKSAAGVSPVQLQLPTLGDRLQQRYGPAAQVLSFGWKDRSALLAGGARSDGSYFIERTTGAWVTTDRIRPALPAWLAALNERGPIESLSGRVWQLSIPEDVAQRLAGPDDASGEGLDTVHGPTFPHPISSRLRGAALVQVAGCSPLADEVVLDAVAHALEIEDLGRDEIPDLLCVSLAALDLVGHVFGPDSREVADTFARADRCLARLMTLLDEQAGPGAWALALTGDHGVAPLPERSGGARVSFEEIGRRLETDLRQAFGQPSGGAGRWIAGLRKPSVYLQREALAAPGVDGTAVARRVARTLASMDGIAAAATRDELRTTTVLDLSRLRRDVHPDRSGDVLFLLERFAVASCTGTGHGTHHDYDRKVPLLLLGHGIRPGRYETRATPLDLAPTLAHLLALGPWEGLDGQVLGQALTHPPGP